MFDFSSFAGLRKAEPFLRRSTDGGLTLINATKNELILSNRLRWRTGRPYLPGDMFKIISELINKGSKRGTLKRVRFRYNNLVTTQVSDGKKINIVISNMKKLGINTKNNI